MSSLEMTINESFFFAEMVREQRREEAGGQTQAKVTGASLRSRCASHQRVETARDPGMVQIRMLFSKGKTGSLVLCNVTMATKAGGGKSHCLLSDLPLGWDSTGLSSRP